MKPFKHYPPLKVGLVGAAIIAVLVVGSTAFGTLGLTDARYEAELANAGGVRPGDDVRVAGISVGRVSKTRLDGDKVLMTFRVERGVHVGEDTRLAVKLSTLLGGRYVDLRPRGTGELDGRIPLARTDVPYDLQQAVEASTLALEELDGKKLRKALEVSTDAFRELDPKLLGKTFDGITQLSDIITKREDQLSRLLASTESVTKTLNANGAQIYALLGQGDRLLKQLLQRRQLIRSLLADFREISNQLSAMLDENRANIKPLMKNVRGLTDVLRRNDEALGKALARFAPAARYLNNTVGNGPYAELALPYGVFPDNLLCTAGVVGPCR